MRLVIADMMLGLQQDPLTAQVTKLLGESASTASLPSVKSVP